MSKHNSVSRSHTWKFSHSLYTSILPEARSGLHPTSTIDPFVLFKRLFDKLFKDGPLPIAYIHLRVSRAEFDLCVARGKMVLLCQIFHLRASFRPDLSLDYHVCSHGWTHCGLPSGQNCVAIHNTGTNSSRLTMPRSCISLYAGNLPSGPAEEGEETPRLPRYLCATYNLCF
jgi:hypothetical protein